MPLLILQCALFHKALAIRILHQDDAFAREEFMFVASNNFTIRSTHMPEIAPNDTLFIRGVDDEHDEDVMTSQFDTNTDRDIYINALQVAVGELNQHYKATGKPTSPLAAPVSAITIVG